MNELNDSDKKKLSAVCGLFCQACSMYIGTTEDPERLRVLADRFQQPVEACTCYGCRSEKRSFYCENLCYMYSCAAKRGLDFCGECEEYPCEELKKFQAERPHRLELWESLKRIREAGYLQWFEEEVGHYACPDCGTINSAYDRTCRSCGREPSCRYVELHKDSIWPNRSK